MGPFDVLIKRIRDRMQRLDMSDPETSRKLTRMALLLENQTKINVRRQGLVDTGNLLNSIGSMVEISDRGAKITYGSFGVDYAGVHEFGFVGAVPIRAHTRRHASGTVHQVRAHTRNVRIRSRPYIRPSLIQQRRTLLKIMSE